jgi:ElaA protein
MEKIKNRYMFFGYNENKIIAYTRLFKPGDYFKNASIGRVVIALKERNFGYGHDLMNFSIKAVKKHFKCDIITISAQKYLKKFYESHGFNQKEEGYLEDGIPHIKMEKEL